MRSDTYLGHAHLAQATQAPGVAPTRPSCMECVQKHLGAALVLMAEVNDGYASHRLRAIGHLHEAEDESQEWPSLHRAIREARKAYQNDGVTPDWDQVWDLLVETMTGDGPAGATMSGLPSRRFLGLGRSNWG